WYGSGLWSGFTAIAAGDLNGDGETDIAGIDANHNMTLFTGDGGGHLNGGTAQGCRDGTGCGCRASAAGHCKGDGKVDIGGTDWNHNMTLDAGDGGGHMAGGTAMWYGNGLWSGFTAIAAGDFNGDGKVDIAAIDANHNMTLFTGDGAGHLTGG